MAKPNTLIISPVRNIYDRNLSVFLKNLNYSDKNHPGKDFIDSTKWYYEKYNNNKNLNETELQQLFKHFRKNNLIECETVLKSWYYIFNLYFGINIFENKFDHKKKYILIKKKSIFFLILRMEDINQWEQIINSLFNTYQ